MAVYNSDGAPRFADEDNECAGVGLICCGSDYGAIELEWGGLLRRRVVAGRGTFYNLTQTRLSDIIEWWIFLYKLP